MSSVSFAPETVGAAAGNLASLGSTLHEATAEASGPTTALAAAGTDDVSIAISRLFGSFGQEFQAISAQALAFHSEFVSVLNGGAAAYVTTEAANAGQTLVNVPAMTSGAAAPAALPILGGLGTTLGGGTSGGILGGLTPVVGGGPLGPVLDVLGQGTGGALSNLLGGGLNSVLSNPIGTLIQPFLTPLFGSGMTPPAGPGPNPWVLLFTQTGANLQSLYSTWAADPFPFLHQVLLNQARYGEELAGGLAYAVLNLPTELANAPTALQLALQAGLTSAVTFNPVAVAHDFIDPQINDITTISSALHKFDADLQTTIPVYRADMALARQAIAAGDYHGAVQDFTHGVLGLFITGFDTSNLSDVKILGPAGDLLPLLALPGQHAENFANMFPPGSIPSQFFHNSANVISTLTDTNVSTTFALNLTNPSKPILIADAFFGLPLAVGFSLLGAPVSGLNGLATGASVLAAAVQSGNPLAVGGAIVDLPAYALNGFLNGQTIVDVTLPVGATTALPGLLPNPFGQILGPVLQGVFNLTGLPDPTIPVVAHLPFDGLLVPPQPVTATLDVTVAGVPVPINVTLGGTPFGGLIPALVNTVPRDLAAAITPK